MASLQLAWATATSTARQVFLNVFGNFSVKNKNTFPAQFGAEEMWLNVAAHPRHTVCLLDVFMDHNVRTYIKAVSVIYDMGPRRDAEHFINQADDDYLPMTGRLSPLCLSLLLAQAIINITGDDSGDFVSGLNCLLWSPFFIIFSTGCLFIVLL